MIKCKLTKKALNEHYNHIISIGYCNANYLLKDLTPNYYTCNRYGWCSDNYDIKNKILISTGYQPLKSKNIKVNGNELYNLVKEYNKKAQIICNSNSVETLQELLSQLRTEFIDKVV